jgi:O-antigen/teichoic acid export membrane protein
MSRSRILALSTVTQGAGALLHLATLPLVARLLGPEAFGIVGLSITFQALLFVIDGCNLMTRVAAEEAATGSPAGLPRTRSFLGAIERLTAALFSMLMLVALAAIALGQAPSLIRAESLGRPQIAACLLLILLAALAKLLASMYRGCVIGLSDMGFSNQVTLGCYVIRFPLAYAAVLWTPSVAVYLAVQLLSFVVEAVVLRVRIALHHFGPGTTTSWHECRQAWKGESGLVGVAIVMSLLFTLSGQADKVVLAAMLPLREFGAASLAIMICAGAAGMFTPIYQVFMPSLVDADRRGDAPGSRAFLDMLTLLACIGMVMIAVTGLAAAPLAELLAPGSNTDRNIVSKAFAYYGVGYGLSAISGGFYWLHLAQKSLSAYRNLVVAYLGLYFLALVTLSTNWGLDGAGAAWASGNLLLMIIFAVHCYRNRLRRAAAPWLLLSLPLWLAAEAGLLLTVQNLSGLESLSPIARIAAVVAIALAPATGFAIFSRRVLAPRFTGAAA